MDFIIFSYKPCLTWYAAEVWKYKTTLHLLEIG